MLKPGIFLLIFSFLSTATYCWIFLSFTSYLLFPLLMVQWSKLCLWRGPRPIEECQGGYWSSVAGFGPATFTSGRRNANRLIEAIKLLRLPLTQWITDTWTKPKKTDLHRVDPPPNGELPLLPPVSPAGSGWAPLVVHGSHEPAWKIRLMNPSYRYCP